MMSFARENSVYLLWQTESKINKENEISDEEGNNDDVW